MIETRAGSMKYKAVIFVMLLSSNSFATSIEYEEIFNVMANDLTNPQKAFEFVKIAVREGKLSDAASTLERILRINPTLSNIQLELGVIYLRLGAAKTAKKYIQQSLRSPEVPGPVRSRAKSLLAIADESTRRHQFSLSLGSAMRYDDNANAGADLLRFAGSEIDIPSAGRHDSSWEVSPSLFYTYAFNSEKGNQLELSLSSYHRRYDESPELEIDSVNLRVGPRLNFGSVLNPSISISPYLLASRLNLEGEKYLERAGAGINLRKVFSPLVNADISIEYSDQDYFNSDTRTNISVRTGDQFTARSGLNYALSPRSYLSATVYGGQRTAEVAYEERAQYGIRVSYTQGFSLVPNRPTARLTLSVGAESQEYDAPDPAIDPNTTRDEDRLSASVSLSIPVLRRMSVLLSTSYSDVDATIPNYTYDNWGASLGFRVAF